MSTNSNRLRIPTVFTILSLASVVALGLVGFRASHTNSPAFSFLVWNLLLAWVPVAAACLLYLGHRLDLPQPALLGPFAAWFVFLPNAPYLVTDLIHLHLTEGSSVWFDATMLMVFGLCGMLLGCWSLQLVQAVVTDRMGSVYGWIVVAVAGVASAAGIYIGRVLRLNSWDVVVRPGLLVDIVQRRAQDPFGNPGLLWATLAGTVGITAGYWLWLLATGSLHGLAEGPRANPSPSSRS